MADKPSLGLGKPKFDQRQLPESGSSFQHVKEDGTAATGTPSPGFTPPPAAEPSGPMPGISGQMPMQPGHAVSAASLTPSEQESLAKIGWKQGDPIPGNLPDLLAAESQRAAAAATDLGTLPPPGDPSKVPPLQMPPEQQLDDLDPEAQQRISAALAEAKLAVGSGDGNFQPSSEGVGQAAAGVIHRNVDIGPTVADDRQDTTYASGEQKRAPEADASGQSGENMTGMQHPGPKHCPHCDWDLAMPDIEDPNESERQSFLGAILGNKPWQKVYNLMGGRFTMTIRQLTPEEVDACYTQVYAERKRGAVITQLDFWEQLTRYRACLQLVDIRSGEDLTPFPQSLEAWGGESSGDNPTTLPQILIQIREKVIRTESLQRVISTTVARFNRLAAKLEANIENADFWEVTESPT